MTSSDISITIDEGSGFCFGVTIAISMAEEELRHSGSLYCLGDIVHNGEEVTRLRKMGLLTIDHNQFSRLENTKVLLRAHGEPPQTYLTARQNHITLTDATCPVVLRLQQRIRDAYQREPQAQIVIFGKRGHAEVLGLVGQTTPSATSSPQSGDGAAGSAIVISGEDELSSLDYHRDIRLFSQTTQPLEQFLHIVSLIQERIQPPATFRYFDTVCRQVSNRIPRLKAFASQQDAILFVCGRKSSNGKVLFEACRSVNPHSFFVEGPEDIQLSSLLPPAAPAQNSNAPFKIGICGATSTPKWLMEQCRDKILQDLENS